MPLAKQLSAGEVAATRSLRGSRYDSPERDNLPVMEFRQRKTLSVYLATPPWDLKPGETVMLKLQIRSTHGIRQIHWLGDTRGAQPDLTGKRQQQRWLECDHACMG